MYVEVTNQIDDLHREVYSFYFYETETMLVLDRYTYEIRQTKRHGWNVQKGYYRLDSRKCTIKESEVPLQQAIRSQAYDQFIKKIKVGLWSETARGATR